MSNAYGSISKLAIIDAQSKESLLQRETNHFIMKSLPFLISNV
jgi:hypothetical protein